MQIISGKLKKFKLNGYDINGTRPTISRVKESMFSMINMNIKDSIVLDLFSGSGNLGLECVSNYSKYVYMVDNNIKCVNTIRENIKCAKVEKDCTVINMDYITALKSFKEKQIKFDLVFLDPPYKLDIIDNIFNKLLEYNLLNNEALIIVEYEKLDNLSNYNNITSYKYRDFKNKKVEIFKYSE